MITFLRKMLRTRQVAKLLGVDESTVRNLIERGHFPGAHKIDPSRKNSPLLIPEEEVEAFQRQQTQGDK